MIDPADDGVTLPLPVTSERPHSVRYMTTQGVFTVHLQKDLLGDWQILQSWGRMAKPVDTLEQGIAMLSKIVKQFEKQGGELLYAK